MEKIGDDVRRGWNTIGDCCEHECVVTWPPGESIRIASALDCVITATPVDHVRTTEASQDIVSAIASDHVIRRVAGTMSCWSPSASDSPY